MAKSTWPEERWLYIIGGAFDSIRESCRDLDAGHVRRRDWSILLADVKSSE
jgi:hypothetical protein